MSSGVDESSKSDRTSGFLSRWSRLKREATPPENLPSTGIDSRQECASTQPSAPATPPPGDEDMPAISSLDETSDYSGFLSEKVSEALRRQALRKLFHSQCFNVCDGLDDYAEDFVSFAKLGEIVTSDMRHQLERVRERLQTTDEDLNTTSDRAISRQDEDLDTVGDAESPMESTPEQSNELNGNS